MSNGVKWYCPEVLGGIPAYTPEELGANVDEDGNPIATISKPSKASKVVPIEDASDEVVEATPVVEVTQVVEAEDDFDSDKEDRIAAKIELIYNWLLTNPDELTHGVKAKIMDFIKSNPTEDKLNDCIKHYNLNPQD
ncbi:MAG: hypothetical protein EBX40_08640 [Gammaproteobacteria bacterium]|nr:hypothetical protein [Gammaproteobacteria bacterium]